MEGGQKQIVSLESKLDIKSSDMLVSVSEPQFQHNRQQYQGRYMPSSLRFELDGWAVGNDVYNFKMLNKDIKSGDFYVVKRKLNNNPAYVFIFQKSIDLTKRIDYVQMFWNAVSSANNDVTVVQEGVLTKCTGTCNNKQFTMTFNPIDNTDNIDNNAGFEYIVVESDGIKHVTVNDLSTKLKFIFNFKPASDMYTEDIVFDKLDTYADGKYTFGEVIVDEENRSVTYKGDIVSSVFNGTKVDIDIERLIDLSASAQFVTETFVLYLNGVHVDTQLPLILPGTRECREANFTAVTSSSVDVYSNSKITFSGYLPVWCGAHFEYKPDTTGLSTTDRRTIYNSGGMRVRISSTAGCTVYDGDVTQKWEAYKYIGPKRTQIEDMTYHPAVLTLNWTTREATGGGPDSTSEYDVPHSVSVPLPMATFENVGNFTSFIDVDWPSEASNKSYSISYPMASSTSHRLSAQFISNSNTYVGRAANAFPSQILAEHHYNKNIGVCIKGYYAQYISFTDRLTDSNNTLVMSEAPSSDWCIDRGENKFIDIEMQSMPFSGLIYVSYKPVGDFRFYIPALDNMGQVPSSMIPPTVYSDSIEVVKDADNKPINSYNMDTAVASPSSQIKFTPVTQTELKQENTLMNLVRDGIDGTNDKFISDILPTWQGAFRIEVDTIDANRKQNVRLFIKDTLVSTGVFNTMQTNAINAFSVSAYDGVIDGYHIVINSYDGDYRQYMQSAKVDYAMHLNTELASYNEGTLISYADNKYTFTYNDVQFYVDMLLHLIFVRDDTFVLYDNDDSYVASIDSAISKRFDAIIKGPFGKHNVIIFDDDMVTVNIDGVESSFDYNELLASDTLLKFLYTQINDEELATTEIEAVKADNEYQFLRQQWDTTTDTDNFWWLDSTHILVLKQDRFILREKSDELDDWNGDVFIDKQQWVKRDIMMMSDIEKYGCTCAYNDDTALFYMVRIVDDLTIEVLFWDPLTDVHNSIQLSLLHKELGTRLNEDVHKLNTYSNIKTVSLMNSKFSATCRDNKILFGIHYNNNYNQWTVKIDRDTFEYSIVQGYGYVGIDGSLTGGEIPVEYFNEYIGFTSKVDPLSVLKADQKNCETIEELLAIDVGNIIVGTDMQQWYVTKELTGIVSHLVWSSASEHWKTEVLPITNKLSQNYASGSFASYTLSDYLIQIRPFTDLFPAGSADAGMEVVMTAIRALFTLSGLPSMYLLYPKIATVLELQQTFGQAAYVHRNVAEVHKSKDITKSNDLEDTNDMGDYWNTDTKKRDKTLDEERISFSRDEVTFNSHIAKQSASILDFYGFFLTSLLPAFLSDSSFTEMNEIKVNAHQNKTSTTDTGKQYTTTYTKNVEMTAVTENVLQGISPSVNSAIAGALSLDMFYTTADLQEISAGPGWVNHNFVAQCAATSVTAHHMEVQQSGIEFIIKKLSVLQLELEKMVWEKLVSLGEDEAGAESNATTYGAVNFGWVLAMAAMLGIQVAKANVRILDTCIKVMDSVLDTLGADHMRATVLVKKSTHTIDPEAKHNYGDKSEHFMWPCFNTGIQSIPDETADVVCVDSPWDMSIPVSKTISGNYLIMPIGNPKCKGITTHNVDSKTKNDLNGPVHYFNANIQGNIKHRTLPDKMAYIIGAESLLQKVPFRNENIGESEPVFPTAPFQDYCLDSRWDLSCTSAVSMTTWIGIGDTKIIDGEMSNAVISDSFCGVASSYCAVEVKRGINLRYLRPVALTPNALGLNISGKNCCYNHKAYHAFDSRGYRVVNWMGEPGLGKQKRTWLYSFLVNDRFKRSNKLPLNEFLGNFKSEPVIAVKGDDNDRLWTLVTQPEFNIGMAGGTIGEDKVTKRYAIPVFTEFVQALPAVVKTISSIQLNIVDGVTSLTTLNRDLQSAYKSPVSVDFAIGKQMYRYTQEYICSLEQQKGITVVKDLVPCLGLTFLGSTQSEAYLYSQATRQYYSFTGGTALNSVDTAERFRNIKNGYYDFINQEVLMPCLATFDRMDVNVHDDENETDNVIIPRLKQNQFNGEVQPPLETIYNTRSWFKTLSLPCGLVYQGPNRCIVTRFILQDYMVKQIKDNYGKWKRISRENYHPFREYKKNYEWVDEQIGEEVEVKGWTHNPFLLVTAPLGVNEQTDCMFEWEITFCWPVEMDKLYDSNNYAVVNIQAQTMTPGGKVIAQRPVHVFLTKELFTRTGNYGYYSFRYQSNNGAGNRERLHIWSDQYICISSLQCEYKTITAKRTEILTQQADVQFMDEI